MTDCIFCNPSKTEKRSITKTESFSIVATLGQITKGYILIIPSNHIPCIGAMDNSQVADLDLLVKKTVSAIKQEFHKGVTIFEHGIVGQTINHAHLHLFPHTLDLLHRINQDFSELEIQIINNLQELQALYQIKKVPYLLCSVPYDAHTMYAVCWNPPAPSQYLRIITAKYLGVPERADWKQMDPQQDEVLIDETIARLSKYFIK